MRSLHKFFGLAPSERRLLLRAMLLLGEIRLGLMLLPLRTLRRVLAPRPPASSASITASRVTPDQIAWAVTMAGRHVPSTSTCLIQALAAEVLLRRLGYPASLHLGVAKGEAGALRAHAWVESDGRIVVGGSPAELEGYSRFPALDSAHQGERGRA